MLTLIWYLFHPCVTALARKRLVILPPVVFRDCVGTYQGNKLTCKLPGDTLPQLSQLSESLWTDLGLKCEIVVCKLSSTLKNVPSGND